MITRQEKSSNLKDAKKAGVSEFEKNEVKKALDEIVKKAMDTKKAEGELKKPVSRLKNSISTPKKSENRLRNPMTEPKKPVNVPKKVVSTPKKSVDAAQAAARKVSMTGKRIDFVKKSPLDKAAVKEPVKKLVGEPKQKTESTKAKKPVMKTRTVAKMPFMKPNEKVTFKKEAPKKKVSNTPPVVSIIMPVHNGARCIDSAIHSVLGQTFQDFELIIVDDCSEDGTLRVVREFSSDKIKSVALTQKGGMANARNVGVDKATGQYICFLNAHDMWQPDKLERQLEFVQEKHAAFSYAGYVYSDENGMPSGKVVRVPSEITGLQVTRISSILVSTVMLDMSKLTKDDIKMPAVRNPKTATWQKILKKVGRAYGLNEVLAIHGYDDSASLLKKMWRRV